MRFFVLALLVAPGCDSSPIQLGSETIIGGNADGGACAACGPATASFSASSFETENQPISVAAGDFDGDGKIDLVTSNNLSQTLSYSAGNGDGTFHAATSRPGAYGLLVAADVDGDQRLDLVVGDATRAKNLIAVLLGNGDGTFRDGAVYGDDTVTIGPGGLIATDLNRDGRIDLIYSRAYVNDDVTGLGTPDQALAVRLGKGDGTFAVERIYDTGDLCPAGVEVADFNGDAKLDVVVATDACGGQVPGGSVKMFLGNGDGTLQPASTVAESSGPCRAVVSLDLDRDGKLDLATADCSNGNSVDSLFVSLLRGRGDGTFDSAQRVPTESYIVFSVAAADFNLDGSADLVFPETLKQERGAQFLYGAPHGQMQAMETEPTGSMPRTLLITDVNGDGRPDVAVVNQASNSVTVLVNTTPQSPQ